MTNKHAKETPLSFRQRRLGIVLLVTFAAVGIVGWITLHTIDRTIQLDIKTRLEAGLDEKIESLHRWFDSQKAIASLWATNPKAKQNALALIEFAQQEGVTQQALLESAELTALRKELLPVCQYHHYDGFVIVDANGVNVGALSDELVGARDLAVSEFLRQVFGEDQADRRSPSAQITLPSRSRVTRDGLPTLFTGAPLHNEEGEIVAALCFRIRPDEDFSQILNASHFGESGESYLFDRQGVMISESLFCNQLLDNHLLLDETLPSAILNVEVRDPGGNVLKGFAPLADCPLTLMAASAVRGEAGVQVEGYRDYRGISVLGAWDWLEEYDCGITLETDRAEAYAPLYRIRMAFGIVLGLVAVAAIAITRLDHLNSRRAQMLKESRVELEHALNDLQMQKLALDKHAIVAITDKEGVILDVNEKFCEISQYSREEVLGQDHQIINSGYHPKAFFQEMWQTINQGRVWQNEIQNRSKDGTIYWVQTSIIPHLNKVGEITQFIALSDDGTRRKKAEAEMILAKEQAESANLSKSEFLANMSHEIRTPMNGVIGMTELVLDTELSEDQRDCIETIKISADALVCVINDILDFSKIEAGKMQLEEVSTSLRKTISDGLTLLSLRAREKGIELLSFVEPQLPDDVITDPVRLRQVLINLVGNGIKFTKEGEVAVHVSLLCETANWLDIEVRVRDTGVGIPPERIEGIFEAFSQADTSTTRTYGGTGLGLSISSQLVEMMGGKIRVASEPGQGSTFWFTFRVGKGEASLGSLAMPAARVLLVDDDSKNREEYVRLFEEWGMPVAVTASAQEAYSTLIAASEQLASYDLLITDDQMPEMDGIALVRQMRSHPALEDMPVILLSSGNLSLDSEELQQLRLAGHLAKPFPQNDLQQMVRQSLEDRVQTVIDQAVSDPVASAREATEMRASSNFFVKEDPIGEIPEEEEVVPLCLLLVEDNLINQKVAIRMLKKMGHQVELACNGLEALETTSREKFDVILMDAQMPEMDGLTATAIIRDREQRSGVRTPIIAMTANAMEGDRERCLNAGMDDYVSKPVDTSELSEALRRATEHLRQSVGLPMPPAPHSSS